MPLSHSQAGVAISLLGTSSGTAEGRGPGLAPAVAVGHEAEGQGAFLRGVTGRWAHAAQVLVLLGAARALVFSSGTAEAQNC